MFVVLQHPFADLRSFDQPDECHRVRNPPWPLGTEGVNFVRSSGSIQPRRGGGVAEWEGEDRYADASSALRFPDDMAHLQLGPEALAARCGYSFRRFYSQGMTARVEIGLRLSSEAGVSTDADKLWRDALFAWLSLEVAVGPRGNRAAPARLIDTGGALAKHFLRASTYRHKLPLRPDPPVPQWWFQAGIPSLIVETLQGEPLALPPHTRPVGIAPELGTLQHAWLQIGVRRVSAWFLASTGKDPAALRRLRIHLLRLHAERETLRAVLTAVTQHKLEIEKDAALSDAVQLYLNDAIRAIERPARFGVEQTEMIDVARAAFGDLFAGDTSSLATMRRQVGSKVEAFVRRASAKASTVNEYHYHGEYMSTTITLGNVTVSGDFNLVTAKSIENSFNKAATTTNPALATALKDLSTQVAELVKALPPDKKEAAARDLETLTTEATAKAPRKAWYELSAEGLKDAAKAVAGMAGPIATAVGTVLGLLTL